MEPSKPIEMTAAPSPAILDIPEVPDTPPQSRVRRRAARMNTRLVGIDRSSGVIETLPDLGGEDQQAPGWLIVISGPDVGNSYRVSQGICTLGVNINHAVQLFYGNVSRLSSAYATIFYDKSSGEFFVGNCENYNRITRNGIDVQENEPLVNGDRLQLAQTTLRFVAFPGR